MNLEEMINSDDIEIAKLGVKILRQQKGKSHVANLIRNNNKYEFRKGEGLVKKVTFKTLLNAFNNLKLKYTPLLSMTELKSNVISNGDSEMTFNVPYKLEKE
jgi:hypothetical protein